MDAENKDLRFWTAVHEELQRALNTLPYSTEPDMIQWDHPDEDWKNAAEVGAKEDDAWPATDDLIRMFCSKHQWPKRSKNDARYFSGKRIAWALKFTRLLMIPSGKDGRAPIPRPSHSVHDILEWLLIDAYSQRNPPPPETPLYISASDADGNTVMRKADDWLREKLQGG